MVNGLIGDVLREQSSPVAIRASVRDPRQRGVDVPLTPGDLATAFPRATGRVVVFVHGLCEDDEGWGYRPDLRGPSYLELIGAAGRWTPVAVRYNSGLPIQDNADELVGLLDRMLDAWPTPVDDVALVGHSMGGLVLRASASYAARPGGPSGSGTSSCSAPRTRGAPLERLVERSAPPVATAAEVAPFADILDERSVGIRDLHDGIGMDATWWPQAAYRGVGATLGRTERAWAGRVLGDLLVLLESARGTAAAVKADFRHIPDAHHFDLLNHPEIAADLLRWLGPTEEDSDG